VLVLQGKTAAAALKADIVAWARRCGYRRITALLQVFNALRKAQVLIKQWRRHYNEARPHSALGHRPPAPQTLHQSPATKPGGSGPGGAVQPNMPVIH
jgi:hypothetical protein